MNHIRGIHLLLHGTGSHCIHHHLHQEELRSVPRLNQTSSQRVRHLLSQFQGDYHCKYSFCIPCHFHARLKHRQGRPYLCLQLNGHSQSYSRFISVDMDIWSKVYGAHDR